MNRRNLFKTGLALAGGTLLSSASSALPVKNAENISPNKFPDKRKLGRSLEVSSIGLGVQNMTRTYQTTIPLRSEMINIIRSAYDHGVTLFDAAEAYGPLEVEKILGEALTPIRNKVVIETKFGWNIDPETGQWKQPGLSVAIKW